MNSIELSSVGFWHRKVGLILYLSCLWLLFFWLSVENAISLCNTTVVVYDCIAEFDTLWPHSWFEIQFF